MTDVDASENAVLMDTVVGVDGKRWRKMDGDGAVEPGVVDDRAG
jgi:hypothetical protein